MAFGGTKDYLSIHGGFIFTSLLHNQSMLYIVPNFIIKKIIFKILKILKIKKGERKEK
jgi:hypothetical protein